MALIKQLVKKPSAAQIKKIIQAKVTKKTVKKTVKKPVKAVKKNKIKETVKVNGATYVIPEGWDVKKCKHINHLELSVAGLDKIWLPCTNIEQYYQVAPPCYSEDSLGLRTQAYCRYDNCDLDWMVNLENPPP